LKQIFNTAGHTKTGEYIGVCIQLIEEVKEHAPHVAVSGFIMDSVSANRSAMSLLDDNEELLKSNGALINLQCISHTISLLLKDLDKRFDWVHVVYEEALFVSTVISNTEAYRDLFSNEVTQKGGQSMSIATHCETRFGSKYIVLQSVLQHEDSLVAMAGSTAFLKPVKEKKQSASKLHSTLLSKYGTADCIFERMRQLQELCDPIMKAIDQHLSLQ
jgi:hypothetical protein